MKILGIDPGLGTIGFGVIALEASSVSDKNTKSTSQPVIQDCQWGVIKTTPNAPDGSRLEELYNDFHQLLTQIKPDVVALEKLFFFRNVTTMLPVSQARGVIVLAIQQHKIPLYEYTPLQMKQIITGYGKASKGEIQTILVQLLNLDKKPTPDDAADGLALALCYYNTQGRLQHALGNMSAGEYTRIIESESKPQKLPK